MQSNAVARPDDQKSPTDEPIIFGAGINEDLGISTRTRSNYKTRGILPPPDGNVLGRDFWRKSTYQKFKEEVLRGDFAKPREIPARKRSSK